MAIRLSENFRALFYAPFYAAHAIGAYQAEGVDVELLASPDPARTAAALRNGEIDVMWGGPLRVMLTHAQDPAADSVCFCDVIARDPFFIIGREPRPDFRVADLVGVRFASVAEVPTPWLCLQDDLRRAGIDPAALNRDQRSEHGRERRGAACGFAGCRAALPAVCRGTDRIRRRPCLVCGGGSRPHRLYDAGHAPPVAGHRDVTNCCAMTRAMASMLRWIAATPGSEIARALHEFFPDVAPDIFAAAIDRYRALELFAPDPVLRREGFDRLQAAMRSGGALDRAIPFDVA